MRSGCEEQVCRVILKNLTYCGADMLEPMLVSDSDSARVGPWTKGYLCNTTDGSSQITPNWDGRCLICHLLQSDADRVLEGVLPGTRVHDSQLDGQSTI